MGQLDNYNQMINELEIFKNLKISSMVLEKESITLKNNINEQMLANIFDNSYDPNIKQYVKEFLKQRDDNNFIDKLICKAKQSLKNKIYESEYKMRKLNCKKIIINFLFSILILCLLSTGIFLFIKEGYSNNATSLTLGIIPTFITIGAYYLWKSGNNTKSIGLIMLEIGYFIISLLIMYAGGNATHKGSLPFYIFHYLLLVAIFTLIINWIHILKNIRSKKENLHAIVLNCKNYDFNMFEYYFNKLNYLENQLSELKKNINKTNELITVAKRKAKILPQKYIDYISPFDNVPAVFDIFNIAKDKRAFTINEVINVYIEDEFKKEQRLHMNTMEELNKKRNNFYNNVINQNNQLLNDIKKQGKYLSEIENKIKNIEIPSTIDVRIID
ncbi:MAG: hypothetical protein E7180_00125 [Erysipelotrichaceae bacterium]|nr:hypothetical protein [Erysipelotrichaceae bacterium]